MTESGAAPLGGHTPGPWWCDPEDLQVGNVSNDDQRDWLGPICTADTIENGLLIAAAPELLEALERIAIIATENDGGWKWYGDETEDKGEAEVAILAQARAAIAKARGEQ